MLKQQPNFTKNYAELVLRNAVNTAYSAGRLEEYRQTAPLLGLNWQYLTAGDERVRPLHAEYHMLVFPAGPEYERFMPPNGHNCRCTWIVVDGAEVPPSKGLDQLPAPEWNYAPDAGPF
jgi:SPP1 gp7 family putative phage head morphogenesis protein